MKTLMWQLFASTVLPVQGSTSSGGHPHMQSFNVFTKLRIADALQTRNDDRR